MEKQQRKKQHIISRLLIYVIGIFVMGFGIVLCVKCDLGVSPINSVPYVLSKLWAPSLGTITILFYLLNIAVQLILSERRYYISILLQLPVSVIFGLIIDLWDALLPTAGSVPMQVLCLAGSLLFTAFGIMLIVAVNLVPDPPTGTIQAISRVIGKPIGTIKIIYDCSCVAISVATGLIGAHHLIGFGVATIISAICVGRILLLLQKTIGKRLFAGYNRKSR